ncbi:MAG: serine/threonine-protein kinase [Myxococcota bacterium]|jgi:serine/threonine protein kinase|nr:serine/threonine-protein kinase [Myxococcota bacterium]
MNHDLLSEDGNQLGTYTLKRQLGAGAYGAVFEAEREDGLRAALKVIVPKDAGASEELTLRFLREVELVNKLDHPNIIKLLDFGQSAEGSLWMAFELLDGISLQTLIEQRPKLPETQAFCIVTRVLEGLAYAHGQNIVHRDIKPANIMLVGAVLSSDATSFGVKLLDFGVGKVLRDSDNPELQNLTERIGGVFGTPRYLAPEVLRGQTAQPSTDVYAVALILIELLTGRPAISADTVYDILRAHAAGIALPVELVDSPLAPLLRRCVAKDPAQRPADAAAFLQAMLALLPPLPPQLGETGQVPNGQEVGGTGQEPNRQETDAAPISSTVTDGGHCAGMALTAATHAQTQSAAFPSAAPPNPREDVASTQDSSSPVAEAGRDAARGPMNDSPPSAHRGAQLSKTSVWLFVLLLLGLLVAFMVVYAAVS